MYNATSLLFVNNSINRYNIGDHVRGLLPCMQTPSRYMHVAGCNKLGVQWFVNFDLVLARSHSVIGPPASVVRLCIASLICLIQFHCLCTQVL